MPKKYAVIINEDTYSLVVFLNDGVAPTVDKTMKGDAYLVCEVNGPREITTKITYESEMYDTNGHLLEPMTIFVG